MTHKVEKKSDTKCSRWTRNQRVYTQRETRDKKKDKGRLAGLLCEETKRHQITQGCGEGLQTKGGASNSMKGLAMKTSLSFMTHKMMENQMLMNTKCL